MLCARCGDESEGDGVRRDDYLNDQSCFKLKSAEISRHCRLEFMTKAVFTTKVTPSYNDLPEVRYHFPRTYLNQVKQAVGDHIVYYEPRRSSVELSSFGGRQSYFGVARVTAGVGDDKLGDPYYTLLADYIDFFRTKPLSLSAEYYETALKQKDC